MTPDLECPYCKKECSVNHDEGFGFEPDVKHQMQCHYCEKTFVFQTSISFSYEAEKADCLNGVEHDYQLTTTFPKELSKMECTNCGDLRELTDSERIQFNIGTIKSYVDSLNNN